MKMHKSRSTCPMWMEQSFNFDGATGDEDDDDGYVALDSVVSDSDAETYGPHSVASFPPSVGPESDAFLHTPYSGFAPISPACTTPSDYPDLEVKRPSDDVHEVFDLSSAKKELFSKHDSTEIHQRNVHRANICPARADTHKSRVFELDNVSCALPQLENKTCGFWREESLDILSLTTAANIQKSENVTTKQSIDTNTLENRCMSLEEFIACVDTRQLMETINNELQNSKQKDASVDASNLLLNGVAENTNTQTHYNNTNSVRKRPVQKSIFANPDFSDSENEIPVKRQMLIANQKNLMSIDKAVKTNNPGSYVDDSSGKQRVGVVTDVDNIDSQTGAATQGGQNPTCSVTPSNTTSRLHLSSSDRGQFGQVVQKARPSSSAVTISSSPTVDHNGNLVPTASQTTGNLVQAASQTTGNLVQTASQTTGNLVQTASQTKGNHISPWFVGECASQGQHKTLTGRNQDARVPMQHSRTSRTQSDMITSASVPLVTHPDHLPLTAEFSTNSAQEIIAKLPSCCDATVSSTVSQTDSQNQNCSPSNSHAPIHQVSASNFNIIQVYLNLEKPVIPQHGVVACNKEARISATTTTPAHNGSSFNDISQQRTVGTAMHSFNRSTRAEVLSHDAKNSDCTCLPVDLITAEMFVKSSTDNPLSLQGLPFSKSKTAVGHHDVILISDDTAPGDMADTLPSNNVFSTIPTNDIVYNNILQDEQECSSFDQGIVYLGDPTCYLLTQDSSVATDSTNDWAIKTHTVTPNKDDILNGTSSQQQYDMLASIPVADLAEDSVSELDYQNTCLVPPGSTFVIPNYLTDAQLDMPATSRISENPFLCSDFKETPDGDLWFHATSSDGEKSCVGDVLTGDDSMVESCSGIVHLSGTTGSDGTGHKFKDTGQPSANVKQSLKSAILTKRKREGKAEIDISFQPERRCQLTEEELEKEKRRKDLNRLAAANHRKKNKTTKLSQEQELEELKKKNCQLKDYVARKESEKACYLKSLQDLGIFLSI